MIHRRPSCSASGLLYPEISCTSSRNVVTSSHGTENARVESWEIGEKGLEVDGRARAEELLLFATASAKGAVWGEVLDKVLGKTRVTRAQCSTAC